MGLYPALQRVQVPDTVLLDLKSDEDGQDGETVLLARMHKKHRYNIRLAQKKGVRIERRDCRTGDWHEGLAEWYRLYQITARRDRIAIHGLAYYRNLFEELTRSPTVAGAADAREAELFLYLAWPSPEDSRRQAASGADRGALGGIIVLQHPGSAVATYLYGASANWGRELMPNYLLQWQAICDARRAGMQFYDFFGVPPHAGPGHPMHGLYRFKTGFGGLLLRRAGAWDLPYSRLFYGAYRLLEAFRAGLYRLRHR